MSDTATMTVVDFLRACLGEDEAAARKVKSLPRWVMAHDLPNAMSGVVEHIMRYDPTAVLADIAAKRRILDEYTESASRTVAHGAPSNHEVRTAALADVIQILAEAYADRPGYNESWRPA